MACVCEDRQAIVGVLDAYAACLDARDWPGLDDVFAADVHGDYGGRTIRGRAELVTFIAGMLDGCGPSQHLLGNYQIRVDGDDASSIAKARVLHAGVAAKAELVPYEVVGSYADRLRRTADGWRIVSRRLDVHFVQGDPAVLGGPRQPQEA